ncbi:MAG: hypothetical protein KatS3mg101_1159 [Patescibacteria group bacterium]|nr:MAG: hypothetical protein KatS3mg101_1159 [Patescibacteria group bacterium]
MLIALAAIILSYLGYKHREQLNERLKELDQKVNVLTKKIQKAWHESMQTTGTAG